MHVGGPPDVRYKSFDIELPELEAWLFELTGQQSRGYNVRTIQGFEVLPTEGE